jgi:hypothetical protein
MLNSNAKTAQSSLMNTTASGLSLAAAGMGAFFAQPFVQAATYRPVSDFAVEHYGEWVAWLIGPLWWCLTAGSIFLVLALMLRLLFAGGIVSALARLIRR